jgi:hypothetical protein
VTGAPPEPGTTALAPPRLKFTVPAERTPEPLALLHPDGRVTLKEGYTPDAVTAAFWDRLERAGKHRIGVQAAQLHDLRRAAENAIACVDAYHSALLQGGPELRTDLAGHLERALQELARRADIPRERRPR